MSQQLQSSSSSAESRQKEAAAASVAKRENNWVDAEIRLLIDLCARAIDRWMLPPKTTQIHIAHETGARKTAVVSFSIPPNQHIDRHGFSPIYSARVSRDTWSSSRCQLAPFLLCVVQCRSIDELYEVNGLRRHGARRVRLSTSSLKQLGYCTCEPDHIQTRSVLVITV